MHILKLISICRIQNKNRTRILRNFCGANKSKGQTDRRWTKLSLCGTLLCWCHKKTKCVYTGLNFY